MAGNTPAGRIRTPAPDRRPAPPAVVAPRAGPPAPRTNAQLLQQRLGNQATQALVARVSASGRAAAPAAAAAGAAAAAPTGPAAAAGHAAGTEPKTAKAAQPAAEAKKGKSAEGGTDAGTGKGGGAAKPGAGPGKAAAPGKVAKAAAAHPAAAAEGKAAEGPAKSAPNAHAAIAPAAHAVRQRAAAARGHMPAHAAVGSAQAAAVTPAVEQQRGAAVETVANLDDAKADELKRDEFKTKLKEAIERATKQPTTEAEADKVMKTGAQEASAAMRGGLGAQRDAAAGPLKSAAAAEVAPGTQPAPEKTELKQEALGAPPAPVSAAPVAPAPLPAERLDYSSDRGPTEQAMAENNVTKEQLEEGKDPAFGPALAARSAAEQHEAKAEAKYRQSEAKVQDQAQAAAQQAVGRDLAGMHDARAQGVDQVGAKQTGTMSTSASEIKQVTDKIKGIKDETRADVQGILDQMEAEAGNKFEAGLKSAEKAYEQAFEEAKGGVGTWLTTWGSDWEEHIKRALATARAKYLSTVNGAIDVVAEYVSKQLKAAKERVAKGRKQVEDLVKDLKGNVKQYGEEAMHEVSAEFDKMASEIDQRRDALIDRLAQQYKDSYDRMSAMEEKLREENKTLWQRVKDATVGLIKKIIEFKNMLLSVLSRAADVIGDIIAHPIRFLGNLIAAVKLGLKNFTSNIVTHLKKGLMDWIFGALADTGLQLPDKLDLQGIVSIILQVLGITYANFRKRAVAIVGESVVSALETAAEVFKILLTEGVSGLWRFIKDKLADLKSMVLDAIFDFIKERVIMAGITWVIGLLNPASAFFKACKAIYDIVMFFIERGSQILALVNAIIESMGAIAKGSIASAATWIENALAKAIPVAIGFLASLLGLGDISKTVRKTIDKAQTPINAAMDWVIHQAVKLVKAAGKFIKGLFGKKDKKDDVKKTNDPEHDAKVGAGVAAIHAEEQKYIKDGKLSEEDATKVASTVKRNHSVFKSISVKAVGERWKYHFTASPANEAEGAEFLPDWAVSVAALKADPKKIDTRIQHKETEKSHMLDILSEVPGRQDPADVRSPEHKRWEMKVVKDVEESLKRSGKKSGSPPYVYPGGTKKSPYPANPKGELPEETTLLKEPKTNVGGGRASDESYWRPDAVVLMPGADQRIEVIEATLDFNFRLPGKTRTHKEAQVRGTIFSILNKYPNVPIHYTIRAHKPPGPEAIKIIEKILNDKSVAKAGVKIFWVYG